jgi:hypothetical protein
MDTVRSRLIDSRIADGVAQNKLKKFRFSTSFGGCERKVLLAICLDIANIMGDWAKMRKAGGLAEMRNVESRKAGCLAKLAPILETRFLGSKNPKKRPVRVNLHGLAGGLSRIHPSFS